MTGSDDSGPVDYETETFSIDGVSVDIADLQENFENVEVSGAVPIAELEQLAERWETRYNDEITMLEKAAYGTAIRELRSLIADYRGDEGE